MNPRDLWRKHAGGGRVTQQEVDDAAIASLELDEIDGFILQLKFEGRATGELMGKILHRQATLTQSRRSSLSRT